MCARSLVLFLVFFRYGDANVEIPEEEIPQEQPRWQTAILVASLCLLHGLAVIVLTAVFAVVLPDLLSVWANALGLMAAVLAAIQYLPQIYTTYHLKHVGSLSIPMMCIQTPGGILFAASLFARLGWGGWSSWGIFLLTAIMQGILLSMGVWFELKKKSPPAVASPAVAPPGPPKSPVLPPHRRPISYRTRLDDSTPGRYSAHPEHYGTTPDEVADIIDRQESEAAAETQPLLPAGGLARSLRRQYNTQRG